MKAYFSRTCSITWAYRNSSKSAVEQVGVSELDSLRSTFTILGSIMRCNTSIVTSELGKMLMTRRKGYRPNVSYNVVIVLR